MDIRLLRCFVAVAEEGSIHAGARRMCVAQPALSQAIRKLERDLGGQLFLRSPAGIELTAAGAKLLKHARQIIAYLDTATHDVRQFLDGQRPVVKIGLSCGRVAASELTGPIIAAYRQENPALIVEVRELSFTEQFDAILDGTVDVALVRPPYDHEELRAVPLFSEPMMLAVSAHHPLAEAAELTVEEVLDEPMVLLTRTRPEWRDFWHLNAIRNAPSRSVDESGVTISEVLVSLLSAPVVSTAASGSWRLAMQSPMLRAVPLLDAPRSEVAVGFRRGNARPEVQSFVRSARQVVRTMIDVVPGGILAC